MAITQRRQREREERRAQILEAARTVFLKKGFLLSTMGQVAAEAELSKGTLYLYFKSKDDLFVAIGAEVTAEIGGRFQIALDRNYDGLETVVAMMQSYADFAMENPLHFRNAAVWLASGHAVDTEAPNYAQYREGIATINERMVAGIERGHADNTIHSNLDAMQTASQIWAGLFGVCIMRVNSEELARRMPHAPDFTTLVSGYINIIRAGLAGGRISE